MATNRIGTEPDRHRAKAHGDMLARATAGDARGVELMTVLVKGMADLGALAVKQGEELVRLRAAVETLRAALGQKAAGH